MDSEYEALMAELGTGKPKGPLGQDPQKSRTENLAQNSKSPQARPCRDRPIFVKTQNVLKYPLSRVF